MVNGHIRRRTAARIYAVYHGINLHLCSCAAWRLSRPEDVIGHTKIDYIQHMA